MTWEAVGWVVTEFWVWLYSPGFRILTLLYPFSIFRPHAVAKINAGVLFQGQ